jgi:hypothetical protein
VVGVQRLFRPNLAVPTHYLHGNRQHGPDHAQALHHAQNIFCVSPEQLLTVIDMRYKRCLTKAASWTQIFGGELIGPVFILKLLSF